MSAQARFVLAFAAIVLALGWLGLRRGNADLEAQLAPSAGVRP